MAELARRRHRSEKDTDDIIRRTQKKTAHDRFLDTLTASKASTPTPGNIAMTVYTLPLNANLAVFPLRRRGYPQTPNDRRGY